VLKLVAAGVFANFDILLVEDHGMEQVDNMIARPVAEKMIVGFKRLEEV
jgi:hypothetical protein